jgi:peptide/nickel transport system substrate-binding protein
MAFDRTAMMKSLDGGAGTPTAQYFAVYTPGFDKKLDALYPYDVAKAKALMAKAGYAKGCTITMPTLAMYFTSAAYAIIKSTLSKIGVKVKEVAEAPGTFINNIVSNKYDAYLMQFERAGNPWTLLNFMVAANATFNTDKFSNPTISQLMKDYRTATDAQRTTILTKINKILTEDAWFNVWYMKQANFIYKGITVKSAQAGNIIPFLYNIN